MNIRVNDHLYNYKAFFPWDGRTFPVPGGEPPREKKPGHMVPVPVIRREGNQSRINSAIIFTGALP